MPLFQDGNSPELRRWSEPAQIAFLAFCALFMNIVISIALLQLGLGYPEYIEKTIGSRFIRIFTVFLNLIFNPLLETVLGQWIPLFAARIFKRRPVVQIAWSAGFFALIHIRSGFLSIFPAFGIGWVLASAFLFGWKESWIKAYRITFITHVLHNVVIFFISFL